jgi:hypothetical protein
MMEELMDLSRRALIVGSVTLAAGLMARTSTAASKPAVTVYKSPT